MGEVLLKDIQPDSTYTTLHIAYFLYSIKCELLPRIVLLQSNFEVAEYVVCKARNVTNIPERI